MNFFYWLGQLIRWSLVVMSLYLAIVWQGHEPPVIDASKMQVSEGKLACPSSGTQTRGRPSGVDGIRNMSSFSYIWGISGSADGCPDLRGKEVIVWWIPIYDGKQRLLLQLMDKEKQQIHGNTKEQNLRRHLYDVEDKYGLYFVKFGLLLLALGLVFRKQREVFFKYMKEF